ncbi:phosphate acetyltransferase [Candidatus Uhrbacteria bacterium]|nr:phosphate acetyltransferase [Candidatus Uhrbacteria bacterium]
MSTFLHELRTRATKGYMRTIIFPESNDRRVLQAAQILAQEKIAKPLLVCSHEDIPKVQALGLNYVEIDEERARVLEKLLLELRSSKAGTKDELTPESARALSHDPLFYGMYLLRLGESDGLVAGAVRTTAEVLRAGLWLVGKAEGIQTVSSAMYMIVPAFRGGEGDRVITFSDCAVVPLPTSEQLADIAIAAADARSAIVGDVPRVALLSYSTKGSGGNSGVSITVVRKALELVRSRRPELCIDGELQADAALVPSIAERKNPGTVIVGNANVLVFPSLDAANIAYKLVENCVPEAQALGPILQGMQKPMSDLSRGVQADDIVRIATIVASQVTKRG